MSRLTLPISLVSFVADVQASYSANPRQRQALFSKEQMQIIFSAVLLSSATMCGIALKLAYQSYQARLRAIHNGDAENEAYYTYQLMSRTALIALTAYASIKSANAFSDVSFNQTKNYVKPSEF